MRGGSAAAPAGAPLLARTRQLFFSRRRLQNAPLVPPWEAVKAANAKGSGSVTTQQPTVLVHSVQGCLLSLGLLEDKSPFLHLAQPKASPGRMPSPTDTGLLLRQRRLHIDMLPHRAPEEPLHPTAHRLQSACLPQAHRKGCSGGPLLPNLLLPTQTQDGHRTS